MGEIKLYIKADLITHTDYKANGKWSSETYNITLDVNPTAYFQVGYYVSGKIDKFTGFVELKAESDSWGKSGYSINGKIDTYSGYVKLDVEPDSWGQHSFQITGTVNLTNGDIKLEVNPVFSITVNYKVSGKITGEFISQIQPGDEPTPFIYERFRKPIKTHDWGKLINKWVRNAYISSADVLDCKISENDIQQCVERVAIFSGFELNNYGEFNFGGAGSISSKFDRETLQEILKNAGLPILYPVAHVVMFQDIFNSELQDQLINRVSNLISFFLHEIGFFSLESLLPIVEEPGFDSEFGTLLTNNENINKFGFNVVRNSSYCLNIVTAAYERIIRENFWGDLALQKIPGIEKKFNYEKESL